MLKRLISVLLVLSILLSVAACGAETNDPGTGDGTENGTGEGTGGEENVQTLPTITAIVRADDYDESVDYRSIINFYLKETGKRISLNIDSEYTEEGNEIVFGNTDRAVSRRASRLLYSYRDSHTLGRFDLAYAIYYDGNDIAMTWDNATISTRVLERFMALLQDGSFKEGEKFSETSYMTIGDERKALETEQREEQIAKAAEKLGNAAADALRDHLALANEDFYIWLANLYEPRTCICDNYDERGYRMCLLPKDENGNYLCSGGGFYYCNSARDTEGYYIDIESTRQALSFLTGNGLLSSNTSLNKQMQNDMLAFALSLQSSEDGYFYHPQWGTKISVSRRGRDLSWSTSVISSFGGQPLYDTPSGVKGTLGAPGKKDAALESPLSESSAAVAVSKLVLAAVWPSHLSSVAAFETYLDGFDLKSSSYSAGNTMSSQAAQIKQRDKEGLAKGEFHDSNNDGKADDGLIAAFERHFNEAQNPENGLWQDSVHYNSVNGLMKIGGAYNSLGIKLPYAEAAFMSAVEMVVLPAGVADVKGKQATGSVDVYNPWVAISNVMSNMRKYGGSDDADRLRGLLRENAEQMIRVTTDKTKKFAKPDGSYGYTWNSPPEKSQGAPVCPAGYIEGDINGGGIALSGIWSNMCSALGISISLYGRSDGQKFKYIVNQLDPVIKYDYKD